MMYADISCSYPIPFKVKITDDYVDVERCVTGASGNVYYLRRLHPSNSEFRRVIAFVSGMCVV